jgi:uncharacterized membrane protein
MSTVTQTVEVDVPVRTAYNQWTQFEEFPRFMHGVERIEQVDETHNRWTVKVGGIERQFETEILEQLSDQRIAWTSTDGTTNSGIVTFEALPHGSTAVTVEIGWEPEGLVEKAGAAIGADDRQVHADLDRFKRFIEERGEETGAWRGEPRI